MEAKTTGTACFHLVSWSFRTFSSFGAQKFGISLGVYGYFQSFKQTLACPWVFPLIKLVLFYLCLICFIRFGFKFIFLYLSFLKGSLTGVSFTYNKCTIKVQFDETLVHTHVAITWNQDTEVFSLTQKVSLIFFLQSFPPYSEGTHYKISITITFACSQVDMNRITHYEL